MMDIAGVQIGTNIGNIENLEFVCEQDGYRYYRNTETGKNCCLDSAGYWYLYDEQGQSFVPLNLEQTLEKSESDGKTNSKLKNAGLLGIKFDQNGKPVFPKNQKGLFVLPKDEKGLPYFPVDDSGRPIYPIDDIKGECTFPVDLTDEAIFPRNDQNKPIVPIDKNGQPIFPVDKTGNYIFPLDETNCPIPALTVEGIPVIPKDVYGNFVIPQDRDGKPLIYIASDGVTPISAVEWKHWKKYYKEHARNLYQQQTEVTPTSTESTTNNYPVNSMYHPLNLENQSAYFAADMDILQRNRRVRPEDVDLPTNAQTTTSQENGGDLKQMAPENGIDPKQLKRKKLLEAQLKSVKKSIQPQPPTPVNKPEIKEAKKEAVMKKKDEKKDSMGASKNREIIERREREDSRNRNRSRERKRRRYSSSSSSRSRSSTSSRSRSGAKRTTTSRNYQRRRRTPSSSNSSSNSSSSSSSYTSRSSRSSSKSYKNEKAQEKEEEEIRSRIISRTLNNTPVQTNKPMMEELNDAEEYGPKPPEEMKNVMNGSDMEMSDEEQIEEMVIVHPQQEKGEQLNANAKEPKEEQQKLMPIAEAEYYQQKKEEEKIQKEMEMDKQLLTQEKDKPQEEPALVVELKGPFNVKEVLKSENLELIKRCKEQERENYDQLKLQIVELEVARSIHKRNFAQLREAEKRLEDKRGMEYLTSSADEL